MPQDCLDLENDSILSGSRKLEGIFLKDDGTIEASKKRLEESLRKLHAINLN